MVTCDCGGIVSVYSVCGADAISFSILCVCGIPLSEHTYGHPHPLTRDKTFCTGFQLRDLDDNGLFDATLRGVEMDGIW